MAKDHVVRQGECVLTIAEKKGFFWETLWSHPNNAELKQLRGDPNVLLPGDVLHIPDKEEKTVSGATATLHRFRLKGTPGKLRLKIMKRPPQEEEEAVEQTLAGAGEYIEAEPVQQQTEAAADIPFALYIDGVLIAEGRTDGEGIIEETIPASARRGRLVLEKGTPQERTITLNLGHMDPIDELVGVCKRLLNLGFPCPTNVSEMTPAIQQALQNFQRQYDLEVTGEPDDATRSKLLEVHGG